MGLECFNPMGLTQLIAVTTTASTAMALNVPAHGVRIRADAALHFAFGSTAGSSAITASIPTTSTPANGIPMLASSVEVFNIGPNAYLSFISTAATNAWVTPGHGI